MEEINFQKMLKNEKYFRYFNKIIIWTCFKIILIILLLFIIIDLTISSLLNFSSQKIYDIKSNGFYKLNKNVDSYEVIGNKIYRVLTDEYGYRTSKDKIDHKNFTKKYDVIFLGDSQVYGIDEYKNSLVYLFEKKTGLNTLNAGVPSYSPTTYLHAYSEALKYNLLRPKHTVILYLDISDVQDESSRWVTFNDYKIYNYNTKVKKNNLSTEPSELSSILLNIDKNKIKKKKDKFLKSYLIKNFRFTILFYRLLKFNFKESNYTEVLFNSSRSAFTWKEWSDLDSNYFWENYSGYKPLGVKIGLEKLKLKIFEISKLTSEHNSELYILIAPWPAQIKYLDSIFSWTEYVNQICDFTKCNGVINTFDTFRNYSKSNENWYKEIYINGDIHFSKFGNEIILNEVVQRINQ
jgi:hypothetical protein